MTVPQNLFTGAMMDAAQPVPEGLIDGNKRPAGRRFNVYRNNVAVSLTEAMHQAFPVITKLLGTQNMDGLAGLFLRAHPPTSPLMMFYGAEFPAFLAQMPQLAHLGYLPDIARLELQMRRAYHAADTAMADAAFLSDLAPEDLMALHARIAPAVTVIKSSWPIYDIWRFNTEDDAPKPASGAQDVLITRPEFDPVVQLLPQGAADWIIALQNGASFGTAFEVALQSTPSFDLTTPLTMLLQGGAFIEFDRKG
ncbi:DNA-binding domain-containing protein [Epibacterium ulvae]|uniref:Putative DNA-binding domain-containing protein n=1 Tax=Epibacterium ulvae TaxID=1156985 RepID=A0A1G5PYZ2_9RHOB|nr:DNA-binding domain-containing protein [Epibacterium ulvae]SCZ54608.1 Putative DNA-binding domain-containing protein [Epibacterium ulvae]